MKGRRRIKMTKTRKVLRKLPDEVVKTTREVMAQAVEAIRADAVANLAASRYDTGTTARAVKGRLSRDRLSAWVGIKGKAGNRPHPTSGEPIAKVANILEYGTKGATITHRRGRRLKTPVTIPPLRGARWLGRAVLANRDRVCEELRESVRAAIGLASRRL